MTGQVDLGESLEAFVNDSVRQGRFPSREAVIREGVRMLRDHEAGWTCFAEEMVRKLDEADRAPGATEQASDRLRRRYRESGLLLAV
jgi:antitoxin ParD1/3/4